MKKPAPHKRPRRRPAMVPGSMRDEIVQTRPVLDALIAYLEEARRSLDGLAARRSPPAPKPGRPVPRRRRTEAEIRARELCNLINEVL